jgi:hypothetical protein
MSTKQLWDRVAETPVNARLEVGFSEDELSRLKALADKRGCSVETVLRTMASTINLDEPTIYASSEKAPVSHG